MPSKMDRQLSHSGENYDDAVKCLKARYDHPRLIHSTHVQMIIDTPPLKEGNGKELRRLHDNIQQHVRALKTLGCDLPGKLVTPMIELKLDVDTLTLFEWQKHSQPSPDVPHYEELLEFVDLRAQASETSCATPKKKLPNRVTSFAANTNSSGNNCVVCKTEKHPLYVCGCSLMTTRFLYSRRTTFAQTASLVGTLSDSVNQYTSARYARNHTTLSYMLINKIPRDLLGPNRPLQFLPMLP